MSNLRNLAISLLTQNSGLEDTAWGRLRMLLEDEGNHKDLIDAVAITGSGYYYLPESWQPDDTQSEYLTDFVSNKETGIKDFKWLASSPGFVYALNKSAYNHISIQIYGSDTCSKDELASITMLVSAAPKMLNALQKMWACRNVPGTPAHVEAEKLMEEAIRIATGQSTTKK